jgi:hypothetical protein
MSPYSTNAYKLKSFGEGINTPWSNNSGPDANEFGGVLVMPGALNDIWTKSFLNEGFSCYENQEWAYTSNKKLFGVTDLVDAAYQLSSDGSASLFLSSWGKGIVQLGGIGSPSDLDTIALYTTSNTDGALKGVNGNASDLRTGGLTLDNEGTLWGVQSLVSTPLFSRTADGQWNAYSLSPGADGVALKDIVATNGMLFIQSRTQGIYAFEPSSNSKKRLTTGIGSGNLPSDAVLSLAVDQDDELWIGTDHGLVVLYSPENLFKGGTSDARPILFEEDGVVQKLLGENPVTCLLVDGANQKWIGTRGAGLFLVSPDGLQTRAQFTSSNSPLLSNNILSLAIDPTSGELLIGTDAGIIGYRSNATLGNQSYYPELSLYPNPVRPGYTGPIFAKGCPEGAVVKVTDISGGLVFETRSFGGQARWEGTNHAGEPVKSGVYLFYVSNDLGEITAMGKVLIVR